MPNPWRVLVLAVSLVSPLASAACSLVPTPGQANLAPTLSLQDQPGDGYADKVLSQLGRKDPLLDIARRLEELALHDPYFVERKLYPNVDFYSGIIMRAMGIPTNMFTVMFALGRLPGWIAHWKEMMEDTSTKIGRPRQIYTGPQMQAYVPIDQRK